MELKDTDTDVLQQDPPSKALWRKLYSAEAYTRSYKDFSDKFNNEPSQLKLFNWLKEFKQVDDGSDFDDFRESFFPVTKKTGLRDGGTPQPAMSYRPVTEADRQRNLEKEDAKATISGGTNSNIPVIPTIDGFPKAEPVNYDDPAVRLGLPPIDINEPGVALKREFLTARSEIYGGRGETDDGGGVTLPALKDNIGNGRVTIPPVYDISPATSERQPISNAGDAMYKSAQVSALTNRILPDAGAYAASKTKDPVEAGYIVRDILDDKSVQTEKYKIDSGKNVDEEIFYNTGLTGLAAMQADLNKRFSGNPDDPEYINESNKLDAQRKGLIDRYPELKSRKLTEAFAQLLLAQHPGFADRFGASLYLDEIADQMNLSDEEKAMIRTDKLPIHGAGRAAVQPIVEGVKGLAATVTRLGGTFTGFGGTPGLDALTESIRGLGNNYFKDIQTFQEAPTVVDTRPESETFLQTVDNPRAGKYNLTYHAITNSIGTGLGTLAWFVYGTKGMGVGVNALVGRAGKALLPEGVLSAVKTVNEGGTLSAAEKSAVKQIVRSADGSMFVKGVPFLGRKINVPLKFSPQATQEAGMASLMVGSSYSDYYDKAREGGVESEPVRHAYALLNGMLDYGAFRVLGNVVKSLPPATEQTVLQVFKNAPSLSQVNKKVLQNAIKQGLKETAGETAFIGGAMTAAELGKLAVTHVLGTEDMADEDSSNVLSNIGAIWGELPFSMFMPIGATKIVANRNQSRLFRENLYDAGLNPNRHWAEAARLLADGHITKEQYDDRMKIVKMANDVVNSIPEDLFNKMSHKERQEYTFSAIRDKALKARKEGVTDDALADFYDREIKAEVEARKKIVDDVTTTPPEVKETKPKVKETKPKVAEPPLNDQPVVALEGKNVRMDGESGTIRVTDDNTVVFDNGQVERELGKTTDPEFAKKKASELGIRPPAEWKLEGDNVEVDGEKFTLESFNHDKDGNLVSISLKREDGKVVTKRDKDLALDLAIEKNNQEFSKRAEPKDYNEHKTVVDKSVNDNFGERASDVVDSMPEEVYDTFLAMENNVRSLAPDELQLMVVRSSEWVDNARKRIEDSSSSRKEKDEQLRILNKFDKDLNRYYGRIEKERESQVASASKARAAKSLAEAKRIEQEKRERENVLNLGAADASNRRRLYSAVGEVTSAELGGDPSALALQYFAGGGKVDTGQMSGEVVAVGRTYENRGKDKVITEDERDSNLVRAGAPTIDEVAHNLWQEATQHSDSGVTTQQIKDALIDVLGSYERRHDVARDFVEKYHPEYALKRQEAEWRKRYEEEQKANIEAEQKWLEEQAERQAEAEADPDYIEQIIKQYENDNRGTERQGGKTESGSTKEGDAPSGSGQGNEKAGSDKSVHGETSGVEGEPGKENQRGQHASVKSKLQELSDMPAESTHVSAELPKAKRKLFSKIIDAIGRTFGKALKSVEVLSGKEFDDAVKAAMEEHGGAQSQTPSGDADNGARLMSDKSDDVYGFVHNGRMVLNGEKLNGNTLLHEPSHVFVSWMKGNNPQMYRAGLDLMVGTDYLKQVMRTPFYKKQAEQMRRNGATDAQIRDFYLDEALAKAVGDVGEKYTGSRRQRFIAWLKNFWDSIKEGLGGKAFEGMSGMEVSRMTFEDFADRMARRVLRGEELNRGVVKDTRFQTGERQYMTLSDAKANGKRTEGLSELQFSALDKSDFDKDGNVKPEVAAAIKKEYADIEAKAKANGTWKKAPNGKDSNLNEEEWVAVRSTRFKKWFGDWETMQKESDIVNILSEKAPKTIATARAYAYKNLQGKSFVNKDTGATITIGRNGIDKTLSNKAINQSVGLQPHLKAITGLKEVLENSILAETHADRNNDAGIDGIQRFYGAVEIDGNTYRVKTTVKKIKGRGKGSYYTYEIQEMELMPERSTKGEGSLNPDKGNRSITVAKLLKNVVKNDGKKFDTEYSKVVDENGEPLKVYKGMPKVDWETGREINTIDAMDEWAGFFSNKREVADRFASAYKNRLRPSPDVKVISTFLNIRSPKIINSEGRLAREVHRIDHPDKKRRDTLVSDAKEGGNDGIVLLNTKDEANVYVAFSPNQIKSATDNVGTFSRESNDIRFSADGKKKELPLINDKGEIDHAELKKQADNIENGTLTIDRLSLAEEQGRRRGGRGNVEASLIVGANKGTGTQEHGAERKRQEEALKKAAQSGKTSLKWFTPEQIGVWNQVHFGMESRIYKDPENGGYFLKVGYNYLNFYDTPQDFLDNKVTLHNRIFGDTGTRLELVGFTETHGANGKGSFFAPVYRQQEIEGRELRADEGSRLRDEMVKRGFRETSNGTYVNKDYVIKDLHPSNVIVDKEGNFHFIDTVPFLNTPNADIQPQYRGTREYGNGEVVVNVKRGDVSTMLDANGEPLAENDVFRNTITGQEKSTTDDVGASSNESNDKRFQAERTRQTVAREIVDEGIAAGDKTFEDILKRSEEAFEKELPKEIKRDLQRAFNAREEEFRNSPEGISQAQEKHYQNVAGSKPVNTGRIPVDPIVTGKKPKDISDIIFDVTKGVKQKLIFARPGSRRAAGDYSSKTGAVRIRFKGDLDVTAHEIGHAIDDQFGVLRDLKGMSGHPLDLELEKFWGFGSKPPKGHPDPLTYQRGEGFAEFLRALIVNPKKAIAEAPQLYDLYLNKVNADYRLALERFSDDYRKWAGSSGVDMLLSNVQLTQPKADGVMKKVVDSFKKTDGFSLTFADGLSSQLINSMHAFEKAWQYAKGVKGIDEVLPSNDPTILARLILGFDGKFGELLKNGLRDSRDKPIMVDGKPVTFNWLLEPLDNTDEASIRRESELTTAYMIAERTVELSKRFDRKDVLTGIGGGTFTDLSVAEKTLREITGGDPQRLGRIKEAAKRYRTFSDAILKYMVDKGRLSEDQYNAIKANNVQYVALKRIQEMEPNTEYRIFKSPGKSIAMVNQPVRKIGGSTSKIVLPYVSLLDTMFRVIKESDRNEVLQRFTDILSENRDMYSGNVKRLGEIGIKVGAETPNTIPVYKDGKVEHWLFDKSVYDVLKGFDAVGGMVLWIFRVLPSLTRDMVTLFPTFAIKNIIRDTQDRLIKSNEHSGFQHFFGAKSDWNDIARLGGLNAGYYVRDRGHYYGLMDQAYHEMAKNKNTTILDPARFGKVWKGYKSLLEKSETANRVAEYRAAFEEAKKKGMDDYNAGLYAAYHARDLIDFAVAGHYMKIINQIVPFSNAAVQGIRSSVVRFNENPMGFAGRMFIYSVLPAIGVWALAHRNDESTKDYENLPWYQRDLFYNFRVGDNTWISIPKPYELGMTGSGIDRLLSKISGDNTKAFDGYAGNVLSATSPIDDAALAGPYVSFLQVRTNTDLFRDKNIVNPIEDLMDLSLKHTETASWLGQRLQTVSGFDARKWDFFIRSQFAYVGQATLKASDMAAGALGGKVAKNPNKFDITDLGIFRRSPAYNSQPVQDMIKFAKSWGLDNGRDYDDFHMIVGMYFDAKTNADKEKYARQMIDFSKYLMKKWELERVTDRKKAMKKVR